MELFNVVHVIQKYYSYSAGVLYCESVCFLNHLAINETTSALSIICF